MAVCLRWGDIDVVVMPYLDGDAVTLEVASVRRGQRRGDLPELLMFG